MRYFANLKTYLVLLLTISMGLSLTACLVGGDVNGDSAASAASPVISSVTGPSDATYVFGDNLDFTVNFDLAVTVTGTPQLAISLGGSAVNASYLSGSGTTALVFRYAIQAGDSDDNGIIVSSPLDLNSGTLLSADSATASLTFTAPSTSAVLVDGVAPTISSITAPTDGVYESTENLDFTVNFDDNVTVDTTGGTPQIELTIGSSTVQAAYTSGTGTNALVFRYSVTATDLDLDGIAMASTIALNSGTIKDTSGNNSSLSFTASDLTGIYASFTGMEVWLDVNDSTTVQDLEGEYPGDASFDNVIATLSDKSGLANHFTAVSGATPLYVANAVNTNMPVARFDGTNDTMTSSYDSAASTTIFAVFSQDNATSGAPRGPIWVTDSTTSTSGFFPNYQNLSWIPAPSFVNVPMAFANNTFFVSALVYDVASVDSKLYRDGTVVLDSNAPPGAGTNFALGQRVSDFLRGDITEIIIFNRVLTSTVGGEREQVESYLSNKWGI